MSDNWTWQPVEEPIGPVELEIEYYTHGDSDTATHYDAGHLGGDWVSLGGDIVTTINWGAHEDYRLCRRVPAPQGSVPDHVRSVLHAALIVYITECRELDDPDGEMYARQAQQWLDSQRPSQGHLDIAERRIAELEAKLAQGNVTGGGDGER